VFLSYAGEDREEAALLHTSLKQRFRRVFNYRDADERPIPGGEPWNEVVYERLRESEIGISLLSSAYLASGHCRHEVTVMMAHRDSGRMRVFPVKLRDEKLELPAVLDGIQYKRWWDYGGNLDALVDEIVRDFEKKKGTT
jgi:hypothetical protein